MGGSGCPHPRARPVPVVGVTSGHAAHHHTRGLPFPSWERLWESWIRVPCAVRELPLGMQAELGQAGLRQCKNLPPLTQLSGPASAPSCAKACAAPGVTAGMLSAGTAASGSCSAVFPGELWSRSTECVLARPPANSHVGIPCRHQQVTHLRSHAFVKDVCGERQKGGGRSLM